MKTFKETEKSIQNALRAGELKTTGTDIGKILPTVSRFGDANPSAKKQQAADGLRGFFEKYAGVLQGFFAANRAIGRKGF